MRDLEGWQKDQVPKRQSDSQIEDFIADQSARNRLDERTVKAYRLDLGLFYDWMREKGLSSFDSRMAEQYLDYLSKEKKLRFSTVTRKYRVLSYFLAYLSQKGYLSDDRPLAPPVPTPQRIERAEKTRIPETDGGAETTRLDGVIGVPAAPGTEGSAGAQVVMGAEMAIETVGAMESMVQKDRFLSKAEVDRFFVALDREYEELGSDFRKRVCLRDRVMMELLFYHGLEISEILRLELADYDTKTGMLWIRRKRRKDEDRASVDDQDESDRRKTTQDGEENDPWGNAEDRDSDRGRAGGGNRGRRKDKERSVQIFSKELRERLELWIREHGCFERVEGYRDMMFLSKLGKPLSMKMVISIFDKYRIMAGIGRECKPKDLKRSMERYARELMMERCG